MTRVPRMSMRMTTMITAMITSALFLTACGAEPEPPKPEPPKPTVIDDSADLDDVHLDLAVIDTPNWVRAYDPARSAGGYNLILYRRRIPVIIDMNGRIVHAWPLVRAAGRVRLDREGRLAVIGVDDLIKEYDWDGNLIWHFELADADDFPHHDLIRLANGHFLILASEWTTRADYLLEVDRSGEVVWRWRFVDHSDAFKGWTADASTPTHSNSIHELPPNRMFESGDSRFRPGNILVSARNLNTIFIIDKSSGDVVWSYSEKLDHQHEARMLDESHSPAGSILLFDNGLKNRYDFRRSRIKMIDPVNKKATTVYQSKYFYSSVEGTVQTLPGGNLGITSSRGGRAFEITRGGEIVWEWVPPYSPVRIERLALDHCPQLAALPPPARDEVPRPTDLPYVDKELYQFDIRNVVRNRRIAGAKRFLVPGDTECRQLLIPPDAVLSAGFGIGPGDDGGAALQGRFRLVVGHRGVREQLVDLVLAGTGDAWSRVEGISLDRFAYQRVKMCLSASVMRGGEEAETRLLRGNPVIESKTLRPLDELPARLISEREQLLRERQLEALGYID